MKDKNKIKIKMTPNGPVPSHVQETIQKLADNDPNFIENIKVGRYMPTCGSQIKKMKKIDWEENWEYTS